MQFPTETWIGRFGHGRGPAIVAHRGNHEGASTENDLPALEAMARDGVSDAIELDVRRLGDGTLVVHHDAALTDGSRAGARLTDLGAGDLVGYPRLVTLEAWAHRAGELRVNVLAEIKEPGTEADALGLLLRHLGRARLAVMSFNQRVLQAVHAVDPLVPVGLLASRAADRGTLAEQLGALGFVPRFVEFNKVSATPEALDAASRAGIDIMYGTGDAAFQRAVMPQGATIGIVTDAPTAARRVRDDVTF